MENKTYYWVTRKGESINVDDMDVKHLRNTLKMIIKNNQPKQKKRTEFTLRGDMANQFNEQQEEMAYDEYYDTYDFP